MNNEIRDDEIRIGIPHVVILTAGGLLLCLFAFPDTGNFWKKLFIGATELSVTVLLAIYLLWGTLSVLWLSISFWLKRYHAFCDKMDETYLLSSTIKKMLGETNTRITREEGAARNLECIVEGLETRLKKLEPIPQEVKQEADILTREFTGEIYE